MGENLKNQNKVTMRQKEMDLKAHIRFQENICLQERIFASRIFWMRYQTILTVNAMVFSVFGIITANISEDLKIKSITINLLSWGLVVFTLIDAFLWIAINIMGKRNQLLWVEKTKFIQTEDMTENIYIYTHKVEIPKFWSTKFWCKELLNFKKFTFWANFVCIIFILIGIGISLFLYEVLTSIPTIIP